jgi:hypothetical protein
MILNDENYAFFVALKKTKTYALRWTNQQSKSCGIGQKKIAAPLVMEQEGDGRATFPFCVRYPRIDF